MKHLGDITKIDGRAIAPVDCICFGSPCQDLSVAGKRAGLDGERSGLFMESIRIFKEMRDEFERLRMRGADKSIRPLRYALWENVAGAFSSNGGDDFRIVLEELINVKEPTFTVPRCKKWSKAGLVIGDSWSIAWRLFDAQYWGVPQRRKRIAVLVDWEGQSAGDILLLEPFRRADSTDQDEAIVGVGRTDRDKIQSLREGLRGNLEPSIPPWKGIARNPKDRIGASYTLKLRHTGSECRGGGSGPLVQDNLSATLSCNQDQTLFANNYGFDGGTFRDIGKAWYEETAKTVVNGTCPGHHNHVCSVDLTNHTVGGELNGTLQSSAAHNTHSNNVVLSLTHTNGMMCPAKDMANTLSESDYKDPPIVMSDVHATLSHEDGVGGGYTRK